MRKNCCQAAVLAVTALFVPISAEADRGEGGVSFRILGSMSSLRHPDLVYIKKNPRFNALTTAVEGVFGIGAKDWLDISFGTRFFLPVEVIDKETSVQGFPAGKTSYKTMSFQIPLTATVRYNRGRSTALGLTAEVGIEWSHWTISSSADQQSSEDNFDIIPGSTWSNAVFVALEPALEWRYFDHFSLRLGPRLALGTNRSIHLGLSLGATGLFGIGIF